MHREVHVSACYQIGSEAEFAYLLGRWLAKCEVNGTCHCTSVKPAIGVNTDRLASEFLEVAMLVNGL
jgi:hypothetical protein